MTTYRRFTVDQTSTHTVITEITSTDSHPMNWSSVPQAYTREGAWHKAQAAYLPATIVTLDGAVQNFTAQQVFNPHAFEKAMYAGYAGYGYSMSDGYYAPIDKEAYVKDLRKSVLDTQDEGFGYQRLHNDASEPVKASLPHYKLLLTAAVQGPFGARARAHVEAARLSEIQH